MCPNYDIERAIFDRVASRTIITPMNKATFDRYASPRWPHLFPKETMFALAGDVRGKTILEVGCGEGREAVQLAYCGANVTGIDISDVSIDVARKRADLEGFKIEFKVDNIVENDSLGDECFDIIWCNLILHHIADSLDLVMHKIKHALKPGGMFISREPVTYARWLKQIRDLFPKCSEKEDDPNEQPFRDHEFKIVNKHFPNLSVRPYRILARADYVVNNLFIIRTLARADNLLFRFPGTTSLAGDVIMWARK